MSVYYKSGKELNTDKSIDCGYWDYGIYGDLYYVYEKLYLSIHNGEETWWIDYLGGAGSRYGERTGTNQVSGSESARIILKADAFNFLQEHDLLTEELIKNYFYSFVEPCEPAKMKKESVISAKEEEMFNRVWLIRYNQTQESTETAMQAAEQCRSVLVASEIIKRLKTRLPKIPKEKLGSYDSLEEYDMRFAGQLEGWLAALRWVLDEDVSEFDEWLYDT